MKLTKYRLVSWELGKAGGPYRVMRAHIVPINKPLGSKPSVVDLILPSDSAVTMLRDSCDTLLRIIAGEPTPSTDAEQLAAMILGATEWSGRQLHPDETPDEITMDRLGDEQRKGLVMAAQHLLDSGKILFVPGGQND